MYWIKMHFIFLPCHLDNLFYCVFCSVFHCMYYQLPPIFCGMRYYTFLKRRQNRIIHFLIEIMWPVVCRVFFFNWFWFWGFGFFFLIRIQHGKKSGSRRVVNAGKALGEYSVQDGLQWCPSLPAVYDLVWYLPFEC